MSTKTWTKLNNGLQRDTVRYDKGGGKAVTYRPGFFSREVKKVTTWDRKRK
jgi:hypothetical protein